MIQKNTTQSPEPNLAPPGAGIPFPQKLFLQYFVKPFVAAKVSWEESEKNFHRINEKIFAAIEGLTEEQMSRKILVPPQRGLEDSSRFWSIKMTLEHLVIVSSQKIKLITALTEEKIPDGKADTATVKPHNEMSVQETLEKFKKLVTTDFSQLNASMKNKNSKLKFNHPWFGMMTAQQWHWLMPMHHGLHLKQIREIKKKLSLI
jgi:uncharacterized damage-inducible protein DinB